MADIEFLNRFEEKVLDELLRLCTMYKMLDGTLLATVDIDNRWHDFAPEYMADAVPQVQQYPTVSVAWAAYLGMGMAHGWDSDWTTYSTIEYKDFYGQHGFDDLDEHVLESRLGILLDSQEAKDIEAMLRRCAQTAITLIRHEQIEPQSTMAFHIFTRACRVMYRIGAAIQLKRMGYHFEPLDISDFNSN